MVKCYDRFTEQDYDTLYGLVFQPDYPGYKPTTKEIPNGDGLIDQEKRYAHVADKYLATLPQDKNTDTLYAYLQRAHNLALEVARTLEVPEPFLPYRYECALRVLEYPVGAYGHRHTDFDLFTLSLYRSEPAKLVLGTKETTGDERSLRTLKARKFSPGLHIGELGELIGLDYATLHHVEASNQVQKSIVYFALPNPEAVLPNGLTAGEWLSERYARSRVEG